MPSTEILRVRNCIHITVMLYFHLKSLFKNFRTKTGKTGLYNYST